MDNGKMTWTSEAMHRCNRFVYDYIILWSVYGELSAICSANIKKKLYIDSAYKKVRKKFRKFNFYFDDVQLYWISTE